MGDPGIRGAEPTDRAREIIDAARRCFAQRGYHKTSIKAIAKEAGIRSPSILHYHFENKEAIFLDVMQDALGQLTQRATEIALKRGEGPRGLGAIEAFFELFEAEPDLAPLLAECMSIGARDPKTRAQLFSLLQGIEARIEAATRLLLGDSAGRLPLDPKTLAGAVLDLMTGYAVRTTLGGTPEALTRQRRGIVTLLALVRPDAAFVDAAPIDAAFVDAAPPDPGGASSLPDPSGQRSAGRTST